MRIPEQRALPPILRRMLKDDAPNERKVEVFAAVADRYGLRESFTAFLDAQEGTQERTQHGNIFWRELATALLFDFIPAFRIEKPRRERHQHGLQDWVAAGGNIIGCPMDLTAFYQAQLVRVIQTKKAESGKSRAWVFGWFTNEKGRGSPRDASARRDMLPRPYRHRQTSGSLRQAFNSIPKAVRSAPDAFLPKLNPLRGYGLFGSLYRPLTKEEREKFLILGSGSDP